MAGSHVPRSKLSKNVLQMKFMKRTAIHCETEENEQQQKQIIDDEHWVLDIPELEARENPYVTEPSYVTCERLLFGRMSFKGFNPEIEKVMKQSVLDQQLAQSEEREKEVGVSEEQMTERYESLVGTISKKFTKKRNRSAIDDQNTDTSTKKKKREFLKPADD